MKKTTPVGYVEPTDRRCSYDLLERNTTMMLRNIQYSIVGCLNIISAEIFS
jgi:hypothetical protein